jgi:ribosomal-protein-alanine N-acetyltransferase
MEEGPDPFSSYSGIVSHKNRSIGPSRICTMLELETPRLVIRDIQEEDTLSLHAVFSDPEVHIYMAYIKSESLKHTVDWVKGTMEHNAKRPRLSYNFSILLKPDGPVIGWIGFGQADEKVRHVGDRDFGYALGKEHWNKGYGTESLKRIVQFAFDELDTQAFWGECDKKNMGSARIMEKVGFSRIADLSDDSFCYRMTRGEWLRIATECRSG